MGYSRSGQFRKLNDWVNKSGNVRMLIQRQTIIEGTHSYEKNFLGYTILSTRGRKADGRNFHYICLSGLKTLIRIGVR